MDSNRDDAQRCLDLASKALEAGDLEKAARLLDKSRRMYPRFSDAQDLLEAALQATRAAKGASKSSSGTAEQPARENGKNSTQGAASATENGDCHGDSGSSSSSTRKATREMEVAVLNVHKVRMKSHYEVLGIARDADEIAIKRAYRRLAFRLHPDRNFANGADEAFKRVSQAFVTLSDSKKRTHYDQFGTDDDSMAAAAAQAHRTRGTGAHQHVFMNGVPLDQFFQMNGGVSADDLFEFLFSDAGIGRQRNGFVRRRRRNAQEFQTGEESDNDENDTPRQRQERNHDTSSVWDRFKVIFWIILFFCLVVVLSEDRGKLNYSLQRTSFYSEGRTTRNGVTFFINRKAHLSDESEYQLWRYVDRAALQQYRFSCEREEDVEKDLKYKSRAWLVGREARDSYKRQLQQFRKPWCHEYHRLLHSMRRNGRR